MISPVITGFTPDSESNLGRVLDAVNIGVWMVELKTGKITANSPLRQILQLEPDSEILLESDMWKEIIHPDDFGIISRNFRQIASGEYSLLSTELRFRGTDNIYHWFVSRFQVLNADEDGSPLTLAGTLHDIDRNKQIAHLLYESERSKSFLLSNLPGMAYRCANDADWTMKFVSDGCFELTGYNAFDLIGNRKCSYNDIIVPEYHKIVFDAWEKGVSTHSKVTVTYKIMKADGQERWVWEQGLPVYDTKGEVEALEGLILDVTDQREMEQSAQHTMDLMRYVVEHNRSAVAVHDTEMNYLYVSRRYLEEYRVKELNVIGKNHYEIFPDLPQKWREVHQRVLKGEILSAEDDKYIRSDGTVDWTRWECRPWYESEGSIGGLIVYTEVINDWKRMEEQLRSTNARLESLIANANGPIAILDKSRRITHFNKSFENLSGKSQHRVKNVHFGELFSIDDIPQNQDSISFWDELLIASKHNHIEMPILHVDGSSRHVIWNWASVVEVDSDDETYTIVQGQDISERKLAEERLRYMNDHDYLTGLYNRQFLEMELLEMDQSNQLPLTVLMVDTNGLKIVNDSFGTETGDELLKRVAQVLQEACGPIDIPARYGGDEFVVLMPRTTKTGAEKVMDRVYELAENASTDKLRISVSFGYATRNSLAEPFSVVFKKAEDSLNRNKIYESTSAKSKSIGLVMNTLFEKSRRESLHSKRVSEICEKIARQLNMTSEDINRMKIAGLMHDIGKIGIDESILNKPEALNEEEWEEMKRHSEIGYRILSTASEFSEVSEHILEHHERWDGRGYPRGLHTEKISMQARIIAIADAFDAMTSDRSYRQGLSVQAAAKEIDRCSGSQFDPDIASLFIAMILSGEIGKRMESRNTGLSN